MSAPARYRDTRVGGCLQATIEQRADGATVLRSNEMLGAYPSRVSQAHRAA